MQYTEQNFLLLKKAIPECADMLEQLEDIPDTGTCNMDSVAINLKGWPIAKIRQLPYIGYKLTSKWWKGYRFIQFPIKGQANLNNYRVETANKFLKERGVESVIYYQMD